jgi:hypothetical protein
MKYRIEIDREYDHDFSYKDDFEDIDTIKWIENELDKCNVWAWCRVRVSLVFNDFQVDEFLGGCSYEDEESFKQTGYYEDMVNTNKQKVIDAYNSLKND